MLRPKLEHMHNDGFYRENYETTKVQCGPDQDLERKVLAMTMLGYAWQWHLLQGARRLNNTLTLGSGKHASANTMFFGLVNSAPLSVGPPFSASWNRTSYCKSRSARMILLSLLAKKRPGHANLPCPNVMLSSPVVTNWCDCADPPGAVRMRWKRKPSNIAGDSYTDSDDEIGPAATAM